MKSTGTSNQHGATRHGQCARHARACNRLGAVMGGVMGPLIGVLLGIFAGPPSAAAQSTPPPGATAPDKPAAPLPAPRRAGLQYDVFSRPVLTSPVSPVTATPPALAPAQAPVATWRPPLRAIVMAGPQSMVLVDRAVVEMGGWVDGFRLDAVNEDHAVFVKGRERVTLWLGKSRDLE